MNDAVRVVCGVMWPRDSLVSREVPLCSVLQHKDTSESVSPREAIDFSTLPLGQSVLARLFRPVSHSTPRASGTLLPAGQVAVYSI
jgi:hypothetical protein